ncbi:MAG: type IV pilus assembly protein PilM [Candidatus Theseobacter exili]|nr:type IV pilus assembly protein PilM [Candidatus Theseobacter exili]
MAKNKFLGIDIGTQSIKLVELKKTGSTICLDNFAILKLENEEYDLESINQTSIGIRLNKLIKTDFAGPSMGLSISGKSVFSRFVKLPPVDRNKIGQIVQYEAQQQVPFPLEEVLWDYQTMENPVTNQFNVILVATKKEIINDLLSTVSHVNFKTEIIDITPIANYNVFHFAEQMETESAAVVDIGYKTTDLILVEGKNMWSRSIPMGGDVFLESIQRELKVDKKEAELLLANKADLLASSKKGTVDTQETNLNSTVLGVMKRLVAEISRSIGYYRTQFHGTEIKTLYLTGGCSRVKNIHQYLSTRLHLEVQQLNPLKNLDVNPNIKKEIEKNSHLLSGAIGVALQKFTTCPVKINLLPSNYVSLVEKTKKKRYVILSGFVAILLAISFWAFSSHEALLNKSAIQEIDSNIQKVNSFGSSIDKILEESYLLIEKMENIQSVVQKRTKWFQTLLEIERAIPRSIWLQSFSTSTVKVGSKSKGRKKSNNLAVKTQIILKGRTSGIYKDISGFRDSLRKSPLFENVEIQSASPPSSGIRQFIMEMNLKEAKST